MVSTLLLRKLVRDMLQRKAALVALLMIVTIGVGCWVGMATVFLDMDGARHRYYVGCRLADFTVDLKRAPAWAIDQAAALPNVRAVRGRVNIAARIDLPARDEPISGTAISMPESRAPVLNDVLLRSGAWFSGGDQKEVILNEAFARENGLLPGSRIRVLLLDRQHDLLVVGTAMSPEFVYLMPPGGGFVPDPARFGVLYLPERFLQESCDLDGAYNQLIGTAHDASPAALDRILHLIEDKLDPYGVTNATPVQDQMSVRYLADELTGLKVSARVIPVIFLGVAALALNVLMGRLVVQQRTVIGTLKAVGYSAGAVLRHYLGYGILIGAVGGLTGIAFGCWLQSVFVKMYRQFFALPSIEAHFYPHILVAGVGMSILFAVAGTLKGVRLAAGLQPAEAIRPPPPEKGGRVLPERIPFLWGPLPFRWKMIFRAIFRNPFRSAVSILASIIATSLVVAILSMVDSLNYLMDYEFDNVSHQDVTISLREPEDRGGPSELGALPTVSRTEAHLSVACDLTNGPYRERVGVVGLPRGNRLYTPLDSNGRPVAIPDQGLILSEKLAALLDVEPGDHVRLRPLIAERREVNAAVAGTVETFFGLGAYADISYLSRLLGEEWAANVLLSSSFPGSRNAPFLAALKERPTVVGISERTRALTQMHETFGETMGTFLVFEVLFAGLIAFGSVLNGALVSLSERQREVGLLRVLGYSTRQVAAIFSGESCLLNAVGILLGLGGGIGLAHLISLAYNTELYRFPAIVYPSRLLMCALLMLAFASVAQIIIYRMIQRLEWLEVVKTRE